MTLSHMLAYSESQNRFDHYLYQNSLFLTVTLLGGLIGLLIGWLLWRNRKHRCDEIEARNASLRASIRQQTS